MTGSAGPRAALLAGVALVAIAAAVAITHHSHTKSNLPPAAGGWYSALAAPYNPARTRTRTACGQRLDANTLGIAHPVLPCGVKIYVTYHGTRVLTQVIDRGLQAPGREFYVTKALADRIGLHGTRRIRWTYAR